MSSILNPLHRCRQHHTPRIGNIDIDEFMMVLIQYLKFVINTNGLQHPSPTIFRYYDKKKNNCFEFFYKGKGGNGNQFDTASSCLRKCQLQKEEKEHTARSFRFESGEYGPRDMVPVDLCQREPPSSFCKTNSGKKILIKINGQ